MEPIHLFPKTNELAHYNDRARIDPVKRIDIRGQVVMNKILDITVNISAIDRGGLLLKRWEWLKCVDLN